MGHESNEFISSPEISITFLVKLS